MRSMMCLAALAWTAVACAQEKSVKPGINDQFTKNLDVKKFEATFEGESREVFVQRERIVAACNATPGMVVADVGAGTGLFTRLFARQVGSDGQVFAVEIAPKFLEHVQKTCRDAKLDNVTPVLCREDSVDLPPISVDLVFVCDTYHHFEFPARTLASIRRALKPGGRLVVVDFHRIPGKSTNWVLGHVRAGREVVESEIAAAGFRKQPAPEIPLSENYMTVFSKESPAAP